MFDKLKKWLSEPHTPTAYQGGYTPKPNTEGSVTPPTGGSGITLPKTEKKKKPELTPKEKATQAGEPYVAILNVDLDPTDINNGSFELDWNDKFILNLIKQGYKYRKNDTDQMIVDRWFQTVCRNIALEIYEQEVADPDKRDDIRIIQQRDIGGGFTEVS